MLEEDDLANSYYFGSAPPKTLLTPSAPMSAASMYASQFEDDDDPWASAIAADPVADMARSLSRQVAMNRSTDPSLLDVDEIMPSSATASSALCKCF
jgi:hypothetical protein